MTPPDPTPPDSGDRLARLADEYLAAMFAVYPTMAASLGLHEYDGQVQRFQEKAIAARISQLHSFADRLAAIPIAALEPDDVHDHHLLRLAAEEELFDLEVLRDVERNPMAYAGALDVSGYIKRNYAALDRRVRSLTEHLRRFPEVLAEARGLLRPEVPQPFLDTAREVYEGMIEFHEGDLPSAVRPVGPGPVWEAFERANAEARAALREFVRFMTDELQPRAVPGFAIGEERFRTMLRLGEMVDLPLDRLLEIGREDLDRNAARLKEVTSRVAPGVPVREVIRRQSRDHPAASRLVPEAARVLDELHAFIEEHQLVSIPSDVPPRVEETPPFARWAFAMMDTAGPFETASESFYYVTPPEKDWPPEQAEEWLTKFDYATLRDVGIHEVYPGHYVHFLHMKHVSRRVRQVLTSYSLVEGWAHYCEEMMLDAGYGRTDPRFQIAQLGEALLRNVRFIAAIEMHTRGMRVEDAARLFVEHAHIEPLPAEKEAIRGTFDPGYLNYTLGKLMIRKLRDDLRARDGSRFSLRSFHDGLLAMGAPPVPLARRRLLGSEMSAL